MMPVAAGEDLLQRLRAGGVGGVGFAAAAAELHALLLRAAHFEIGRRRDALAAVRGESIEDLALQAADDAFVAVMSKLDSFEGRSRFTTWVYKFAIYEASVRVRRRAWQNREIVVDTDAWLSVGDTHAGPAEAASRNELLAAIRRLVATKLSDQQREVLIALAVEGIPIDVLAERRGSTRGALYKTLHDARRRLRAELAREGHDLEGLA